MSKIIPIEITISVKIEQSVQKQDVIDMIPIWHEQMVADNRSHDSSEFMYYIMGKIKNFK